MARVNVALAGAVRFETVASDQGKLAEDSISTPLQEHLHFWFPLVHPPFFRDATGWSVPPFAGQVHGDYLYGRGTMDDKVLVLAARGGRAALARRFQN